MFFFFFPVVLKTSVISSPPLPLPTNPCQGCFPPFGSISLKSFGWWLFESGGHSGMPCSNALQQRLLFYAQMLIKIFYPPSPSCVGKDLVAIWQIIKLHFKWSHLKMTGVCSQEDTVAQIKVKYTVMFPEQHNKIHLTIGGCISANTCNVFFNWAK